ncbi:MAG: arginine repressor [Lachnoclostridium sp.]|jgi:transcriptional regulator of arginine metabolism|nr:arginine repressor [Lachnoclostridium sp.]
MKRHRQNKIIELIEQFEIETQEELVERLKEAGFKVTQATISRDIHNLSITKAAGHNGKPKYVIVKNASNRLAERFVRVMHDGLISMEKADNLLVIKTVSGMAMAVAAVIDSIGMKEILGSIAGDDTVFCAVRSADLVDDVIAFLQNKISETR